MKKLVQRFSLVLFLVFAVNLLPFAVSADYTITDIALTPGRNHSELNFAWYTGENPASSVVQIALKEDMTGDSFPTEKAKTFSGGSTPATEGLESNKVTVTNLSASTDYVYRIGDGANWSGVYEYSTHNPENFGFVFVGDPQIGYSDSNAESSAWSDTLNKAVEKFPDTSFVMSVGDQVQKNKIAHYNAFFKPEILRTLPLAPAMGNHETGASHYSLHFNLPNLTDYGKTEAGGEDGDYYFTYGNALFMVLNTNNTSVTQHNAFMREAAASNPEAKWKILMFHHSIYSTTDHYTSAYVQTFINGLVPVIDELGTDIVLMGHDHVYVRTHLMKGNRTVNAETDENGSMINPNGTMYVTGNSPSGSKYYDIRFTDPEFAAVNSQIKAPTFSYVNVTGRKLSFSSYRTDTMELVDSFSVMKNNSVENAEHLSLDAFDILKDGKKTDAVYIGDTGTISGLALLSGDSDKDSAALLVMAKYNGNRLVDLKTSELVSIPAYKGADGGCVSVKIVTDGFEAQSLCEGDYIKLFLFSGDDLIPYGIPKKLKFVAEERPVQNPNEFVFECENLVSAAYGAEDTNVNDANCSYNCLEADSIGDYVQYVVNFPSAGTWNISLAVQACPDGGKFKLYLPQSEKYVSAAESDQYSAERITKIINIGKYTFKSGGDKQLRFIVTGKNDSSGGYRLCNDAVIITKAD